LLSYAQMTICSHKTPHLFHFFLSFRR